MSAAAQVNLWLDRHLGFLPAWLASLAILAVAVGAGLLIHRIVFRLATRLVSRWDLFWRSLVARTEGPTRFVTVAIGLSFGASVAPLTAMQTSLLRHSLLLGFIGLAGWIAKTALHVWTTVYLRRFKLDADDKPAGAQARHPDAHPQAHRRGADRHARHLDDADDLRQCPAIRRQPPRLRRCRRPRRGAGAAAGAEKHLRRHPARRHAADPHRRRAAGRGRVGQCRGDHLDLCRRAPVGLAAPDPAPLLFHREAVPELDPRQRLPDRNGDDLSRPSRADRPDPGEGGGHRRRLEHLGRAGRSGAGHRFPRACDGGSHPRQRRTAGRAFDLRCEVREKLVAFLQREHPYALPRLRMQPGERDERQQRKALALAAE